MVKKHRLKRYFIAFAAVIIALLVIIPLITVHMLTAAYDNQIRNDTSQISFSIQQTLQAFVGGVYNLSYQMALNPLIRTMDGEIQHNGYGRYADGALRRNAGKPRRTLVVPANA
jgi:ABC-type long-subunit fatty acid transport system fused permease/ATPase subunit